MESETDFFEILSAIEGGALPSLVPPHEASRCTTGASFIAYASPDGEAGVFVRIEISEGNPSDGIVAALSIWTRPDFSVTPRQWARLLDTIDKYAESEGASAVVMHRSNESEQHCAMTDGFVLTHEYLEYEINLDALRQRARRACRRVTDHGACGMSFVTHCLGEVDHERVISAIAAHELMSGAEQQFMRKQRSLSPPYDPACSCVVLHGQEVAGVLLTSTDGVWTENSLRAVAPRFACWSSRINALMLDRTLGALAERGVTEIRVVLNARHARETVNLAERSGGLLVGRTIRYVRDLHGLGSDATQPESIARSQRKISQ